MNRYIAKTLLQLLVLINLQLHCSMYEPALIKDPIIEMNTSLPMLLDNPASPETAKCTRSHQALYNEQCYCIDQDTDYIRIALPKIMYGRDAETQAPLNTFWTLKSNVLFTKDIPAELLHTVPDSAYGEKPTLVLINPWNNFSVGTRFKHLPHDDTDDSYAIERANFEDNTIITELVPHADAILETKQNSHEMRQLFVKILNNLVDTVSQDCATQVIPYVWGGSSFVHAHYRDDFQLRDGGWCRNKIGNFYTGYDCSELVMRFAQIAGIVFPWKTTNIMERSLAAYTQNDQIEDGDLVWVPGHVMIISNHARNEIIEARGYSSGYGCIHRITLDQCFEGISTFGDLVSRYVKNETIRFKNKNGEPFGKDHAFKLLKL